MQIPIFSDVHCHAFREFAHTRDDGMNSRLWNCLQAVNAVRVYAKKDKCPVVLCAGDVFHRRNVQHTALFNAAFGTFRRFKEDGIRVIFIPGNHDQTTADGSVHALEAFKEIGEVADEPRFIPVGDGVVVHAIPFMEDPKDFKKALAMPRPKCKRLLLLAHMGINGAKTGPMEYKPEEEVETEDIPDAYDFSFFGHYHARQKLGPQKWYIGSPLQQDRGEREDTDKGFLVYSSATNKFTSVAIGMPEFRTMTVEEVLGGFARDRVAGHFVDVEGSDRLEEACEMVRKAGAEGVNPVLVREVEEAEVRLKVDPAMSLKKVVGKYVEEYAPDSLDQDRLLNVAKSFLPE